MYVFSHFTSSQSVFEDPSQVAAAAEIASIVFIERANRKDGAFPSDLFLRQGRGRRIFRRRGRRLNAAGQGRK